MSQQKTGVNLDACEWKAVHVSYETPTMSLMKSVHVSYETPTMSLMKAVHVSYETPTMSLMQLLVISCFNNVLV